MKAKKADKPRTAKTYRLQQSTIDNIAKIADQRKMSSSEVIESVFNRIAKLKLS